MASASKQCELVGNFTPLFAYLAGETDNILILLVGERQKVDLAPARHMLRDPAGIGLNLLLAGTKPHPEAAFRLLGLSAGHVLQPTVEVQRYVAPRFVDLAAGTPSPQ